MNVNQIKRACARLAKEQAGDCWIDREIPDRFDLVPHGAHRTFRGAQAAIEAKKDDMRKPFGSPPPAAQLLSAGSGCHNGL